MPNKRGRDLFKKYKPFINIVSCFFSLFSKEYQIKMLTGRFRKMSGKKGIAIRYCLLKNVTKKCGENVAIFEDCFLYHPENLSIGNNVSIHEMSYLDCGEKGEILIGDETAIAHGVTILASSHNYMDEKKAVKDQGMQFGKVAIGSDVWIGAKSTILMDNSIEDGAIIAAGCVVTKDVYKNEIVGGVPNKVIRRRSE